VDLTYSGYYFGILLDSLTEKTTNLSWYSSFIEGYVLCVHNMEAHGGNKHSYIYSFLTFALDGNKPPAPHSGRSNPRKLPTIPLDAIFGLDALMRKQDKHRTYHLRLRRVRVTTFVVERQ